MIDFAKYVSKIAAALVLLVAICAATEPSDIDDAGLFFKGLKSRYPHYFSFETKQGRVEITEQDPVGGYLIERFAAKTGSGRICWFGGHSPGGSRQSYASTLFYQGSSILENKPVENDLIEIELDRRFEGNELRPDSFWRALSFELNNARQAKRFLDVLSELANGSITGADCIQKNLKLEHDSCIMAQEFQENIWLPFCREHGIEVRQKNWFFPKGTTFEQHQELIKATEHGRAYLSNYEELGRSMNRFKGAVGDEPPVIRAPAPVHAAPESGMGLVFFKGLKSRFSHQFRIQTKQGWVEITADDAIGKYLIDSFRTETGAGRICWFGGHPPGNRATDCRFYQQDDVFRNRPVRNEVIEIRLNEALEDAKYPFERFWRSLSIELIHARHGKRLMDNFRWLGEGKITRDDFIQESLRVHYDSCIIAQDFRATVFLPFCRNHGIAVSQTEWSFPIGTSFAQYMEQFSATEHGRKVLDDYKAILKDRYGK
jgi:hypothetical protein